MSEGVNVGIAGGSFEPLKIYGPSLDLPAIRGVPLGGQLWIHSPGGAVFEFFAAHEVIRDRQLHVHVDGLAYGAALWIPLAGRRRTMHQDAMLGFTTHSCFVAGDTAEAERQAAMAQRMDQIFAQRVSDGIRTHRPPEEVLAWMDDGRWFGALEAVQVGLVDYVWSPPDQWAYGDIRPDGRWSENDARTVEGKRPRLFGMPVVFDDIETPPIKFGNLGERKKNG